MGVIHYLFTPLPFQLRSIPVYLDIFNWTQRLYLEKATKRVVSTTPTDDQSNSAAEALKLLKIIGSIE
jgi:hypothetical protein